MMSDKLEDECPKCKNKSLVGDEEHIWCTTEGCDYEWFM